MKTTFFFCMLCFLSCATFAQRGEFPVHDNGLIYTENTMDQLAHIVDSLNLKYKNCNADPEYFAIPQAVAHHVYVEGALAEAAFEDIQAGIAFSDFLKKYQPETDSNVLVIKNIYDSYWGETTYEFSHLNMKGRYQYDIDFSDSPEWYGLPLVEQWAPTYSTANDYHDAYVRAFYFPTGFQTPRLPAKYACMVQYADCLIDTTATKMLADAQSGRPLALPEDLSTLSLAEKQALLEEMRRTEVIGMCSQDEAPRTHAMRIAILSAESVNWETFLRAHLDIMNDRFERVSDGSYAWGERQTYIRELEELDIDVNSLLLGTALRISNAPANHYYGSISRLGRALSESQNAPEVETLILEMIQDDQLDEYNRILAYFLFLNYNGWLSDEAKQQGNTARLKSACTALPAHIRDRIDWSEQ